MKRKLIIGIVTAALVGSSVFAFSRGYLDAPLKRVFPDSPLFR